ncbi:MAG: hypothetical protein LUC44_02440 [Prevotellaceae bacterium]|nr:hypothetical protein [Prevotellaceae bacterium]
MTTTFLSLDNSKKKWSRAMDIERMMSLNSEYMNVVKTFKETVNAMPTPEDKVKLICNLLGSNARLHDGTIGPFIETFALDKEILSYPNTIPIDGKTVELFQDGSLLVPLDRIPETSSSNLHPRTYWRMMANGIIIFIRHLRTELYLIAYENSIHDMRKEYEKFLNGLPDKGHDICTANLLFPESGYRSAQEATEVKEPEAVTDDNGKLKPYTEQEKCDLLRCLLRKAGATYTDKHNNTKMAQLMSRLFGGSMANYRKNVIPSLKASDRHLSAKQIEDREKERQKRVREILARYGILLPDDEGSTSSDAPSDFCGHE